MDALFASSRGLKIEDQIALWHPNPSKLFFYARSGAKLEELQQNAYTFLYNHEDPTNCHVYFIAGLCDITYMDRHGGYEEVIYIESPQDTVTRIKNLIDSISENVLVYGAKPCFSTIIPSSLNDWNFLRLSQNKTTHLLHFHQYNDMQYLLNRTILEINDHIEATNYSNQMKTPKLANTVITQRRMSQTRFHLSRLADGVHPSDELAEQWATWVKKSIANNRYFCTPDPSGWDDIPDRD